MLVFGTPCFQLPLTTRSVNRSEYITTDTMLFLPLYALLASISIIVTLTSNLVPFGLSISQHTFTLSSTLPNGHLTLGFHHDDFIEAYLTHNGWVQCCLIAYPLTS